MCWNGRDVLDEASEAGASSNPRSDGPGEGDREAGNALSPEEAEHVRQYESLLAAHKSRWTDIDLTGSLEPPRDLFIDVRVLKDAGEIQTEYGCRSTSTARPSLC